MVESGERSEGGINKGEERARVRGVSLSPPTLPPHCFFFFLVTSHDLIDWNRLLENSKESCIGD